MRLYLLIVIAFISISKCGAALQPVTYDTIIVYENKLAAKGSCSDEEQAKLDASAENELNQVLNTLGFTSVAWSASSGTTTVRRNNLRERELQGMCNDLYCRSDYYCRKIYRCGRRRLLVGAAISIDVLQQGILQACQKALVAQTSSSVGYSKECRNAFAGSKCIAQVA